MARRRKHCPPKHHLKKRGRGKGVKCVRSQKRHHRRRRRHKR